MAASFTEDELAVRPALRGALRAVRDGRSHIESPNPTIVYVAEISGSVAPGHAFGRMSATGDTREEALDHLETLVERVADRVEH
jgi:RecB family exonuclease